MSVAISMLSIVAKRADSPTAATRKAATRSRISSTVRRKDAAIYSGRLASTVQSLLPPVLPQPPHREPDNRYRNADQGCVFYFAKALINGHYRLRRREKAYRCQDERRHGHPVMHVGGEDRIRTCGRVAPDSCLPRRTLANAPIKPLSHLSGGQDSA
jgi:hypothetical protein